MSKKKTIIAISCTVLIVGGLGGLGWMQVQRKNAANAAVSAGVSQVLVQAANPLVGEIAQNAEFLGVVEPNELVAVLPKVAGTVLQTHFEVGDTVKKGDLLFEIDPTDIALSLSAAEAQAEVGRAQAETGRIQAEIGLGSGYESKIISAKSALESAQRGYNSARAALKDYTDEYGDGIRLAEREMTRLEASMKALQAELEGMSASDSGYDDKRQAVEAAEVAYKAARANFNDLEDNEDSSSRMLRTNFTNAQIGYNAAKEAYDLVMGQARADTELATDASLELTDASLGATEAALAAQRKQLEYTKVYAPIDGVIEQKSVSAHGMAAPSAPAYTVSNKSLMLVKFGVSESAAQSFSVGDKVTLEKGSELLDGSITEIATMVDPQSGLFNIKAMVENANVPLHTGTMIKVVARINRVTDSLLIPLDSVYYDEGAAYVYTLVDGIARRTPIEVGIASADQIAVTDGLTSDDQVITSWHPKLLDGAAVVREDAQESDVSEAVSSEAVSSEAGSSEVASSEAASVQQ